MQKLKNCNTVDGPNMSAFEFLKKLAEQERLSITYKPRKNDSCDCYDVEMYLKILKDKHIVFYFNTGKTNEEAKNAVAKSALGYFKHF
ncbi:interferon-inducible double-stranded RNA-dependent protein kinase activator A [Aphis craccivora]|uniref:Interferon-inducible double-stranded RNA-dependent protein kinase activator A n=1 Tax=Aphis craccivora TaxID=307492 RepID=A0A6G0ZEJ0_APHCR|nr:interferon-inducible double-stranded RNA-dependent protein kinase activator A [Aphis craccivora]